MKYKIIDIENWKRKEYFEHYLTVVPCTYSISVKLDITKIKEKKLKLYPTMLYYLTKLVNKNEQLRMAFNNKGQLIMYDNMFPCYTIFHNNSETFSNIWTEYVEDYTIFCQQYENDLKVFGSIDKMMAKPNIPENNFTVSMIPWTNFEGFNINTNKFNYLTPIFTLGKYQENHGKYFIPLAVQVHHAVCDGYHVSMFINELQKEVDAL